MKEYTAINLKEKANMLTKLWSPGIIAELNDYQFKVARGNGEFTWHSHEDTDEAFLLIEGALSIHFRDGTVALQPGELFVVPRNVEHKPEFTEEGAVLLIEPRGVVNTGDNPGELTKSDETWI